MNENGTWSKLIIYFRSVDIMEQPFLSQLNAVVLKSSSPALGSLSYSQLINRL